MIGPHDAEGTPAAPKQAPAPAVNLANQKTKELFFGVKRFTKFADADNLWKQGNIKAITIRSGDIVDGIKLTYSTGEGKLMGNNGGEEQTLNLADDEFITEIRSTIVDYFGHLIVGNMVVTTNKGNSMNRGAKTVGTTNVLSNNSNPLRTIFITSNQYVNGIGAIFAAE